MIVKFKKILNIENQWEAQMPFKGTRDSGNFDFICIRIEKRDVNKNFQNLVFL